MTPINISPVNVTSRTFHAPLSGRFGGTYLEQVRAVDRTGKASDWAIGPREELVAFTELSSSLAYTGSWTTTSPSSMWGGRGRYSTSAGSAATLTFRGDAVAWVATKGPTRGAAKVYVDGALVGTVDLYASTTRYRQVVFSRDLAPGTHSLRVVVNGTGGRPRVDVDGFLVLRGA
jgi:hypothetical protein